MKTLTNQLTRLEAAWASAGIPTGESLQAGLSKEVVQERLLTCGLTPNADIIDWFVWHDGAIGNQEYLPAGRLLSLAGAIEEYTQHVIVVRDVPSQYNPGWVPIVRYSHGGLVVSDCRSARQERAAITTISREAALRDETRWMRSLGAVVTGWAERFEQRRWVWDGEQVLVIDDFLSLPDSEKFSGLF